ncbi:6-phospho-beta-glucosidase [Flaviflexus salsibiostraticola]|uniref:6-phospho-beta-glucosidase n=1 Tax=Flaviflexus salsibiostraticola TaxID=1282737 RepID=A0A3S8ZBT2_9ACTO|nr:6-phospho-beta-glucosidase [Flaviflexus salsibiostraticola]AZN30939.1 6-phospho-beta-glucosidase [Flaviflexus salsibiostraticola]
MKLLIVGGGGFRVPQILSVLANPELPLHLTEVCLYDLSPERLAVMKDVVDQLGYRNLPAITTTTDMVDAVRGSDFIFSAMRIGGTSGRVIDEREALARGLLGQETVGPGGYAYAFRTIPEAMRLARTVRTHAPEAWVINFTNPAGIITQAMRTVHPRVVGICDTPIGLVRRASGIAGHAESDIDYDYIGLNHLGWLRSLSHEGVDLLPGIIADDDRLDRLEEARTVGLDWVRAIGMIPNEYLYYYYFNRESVEKISVGQTRGEFLQQQQGAFYSAAAADPHLAGELWTRTHDEREATYMAESRDEGEVRREEDMGGGYEHVALELMTALATGVPARMILGVANSDAPSLLIPQLREDAVIEVPCTVDSSGIHPLNQAPLTGPELGLVTQVKACEELVIDASLSGDRTLAWRAIASHPLVDSIGIAKDVLTAYIDKNPDIERTFNA